MKQALPKVKPLSFGNTQSSNNNSTAAEDKTKNNNRNGMRVDEKNFSRIADVDVDERATATEKQKETLDMYNDEAVAKDLNTHAGRQQQIVDDFALDPQQWYKMYGYWNWNLAKNNPNGNLNDRTASQTLSASRLADALNNKRHWRAAKIGRRTNSSFGTNEYTPGYSERWEPIETQETRQMRANEQMDLAARQRQINRAENIQDYPLELQKQKDRLSAEMTKYASQTGIDLQRAMQAGKWQAEYGQSWNSYWSNFMNKFSRELDLDIRDRVMAKIANLKYPYSQIYAQLSGGMAPNPLIDAAWQYIETLRSSTNNPREQAAIGLGGLSALAGMFGGQTVNTFKNALTWQ